MEKTYLIYLSLLTVLIILLQLNVQLCVGKSYRSNLISNMIIFISVFVYALITGLRFDVGTDYMIYLKNYENCLNVYSVLDDYEIGFKLLSFLVAYIHCHYWIYFFLISFFVLSFILLSFKDNPKLLPWIIFFFFCSGSFFFSLNVLRQSIAISIFIFSVKYIQNRNIGKYLLSILIASLFHSSAIILLPVYIFSYYDPFKKISIQLVLLIISFFVSLSFVDIVIENFEVLLKYINYSSYISSLDLIETQIGENDIGIANYVNLLIAIIIVFNRDDLVSHYGIKFKIIYSIYFIGVLLEFIFGSSFLLMRLFEYFRFFKFIVYAFWANYLTFNLYRRKILLLLIIVIYNILFLINGINKSASKCSPFNFYFENELVF